ncbi:hypothetical protein HDU86_006539 [Geranomyces michiganensis]|nr:hypothetical protein HDU86_006539 [Geranomyces michiganensis]
MFGRKQDSVAGQEQQQQQEQPQHDAGAIESEVDELDSGKPLLERLLPVFACGAGLFSDGYINCVIGSVSTVLKRQYGSLYSDSPAVKNVSSVAFAGTVVGQLSFGLLADRWSRTSALLLSTVILVIFSSLATGSYYKGDPVGMFKMLTAWRFFVGIGIGGEYPAGSVGAAESTGELKKGSRNMWFITFTNTAIDWGFVIGAFVPFVVAAACSNSHYETIWRTSLGIGILFPLGLLVLRTRLREPKASARNSMRYAKTPYLLVAKFYGFRLLVVSIIWFLYDFSTYAFGIYSSTIIDSIVPAGSALTVVFGWNTVINLFYIPGTMLGAPLSDKFGPRWTLIVGVVAQAVVGFIMAGLYGTLSDSSNIAAFTIVYGVFLALGEVGPGNNIGLLASKTCATGVRGRYYGIAAAIGKVGAFVGTYIFPYIEQAGGDDAVASAQYPFYVAGSLCIVSALLAFFFIPEVGQDTIEQEDARFRVYLENNGYDTSRMGLKQVDTMESQSTLADMPVGLPPKN